MHGVLKKVCYIHSAIVGLWSRAFWPGDSREVGAVWGAIFVIDVPTSMLVGELLYDWLIRFGSIGKISLILTLAITGTIQWLILVIVGFYLRARVRRRVRRGSLAQ